MPGPRAAPRTLKGRPPGAIFAEAKDNLMYTIGHWWPYMDHAGKVEVTAFLFMSTAA